MDGFEPKLLFLLGFGLQASVRTSRKFVLELLNTPCGVNKLQLAGVKRVASRANVDLQFLAGAAGDKRVTATTGDLCFLILRMNAVFHKCLK